MDSCQYRTILETDVPRVNCREHGTQMVQVPWAEKHGRFTLLFERLAIDLLQECSVSAAREILRVSWDEADGIKQRAVKRGLARKQPGAPRRLCVDEKSFGRGHDYVTVVSRIKPDGKACVDHLGDGRAKETLDAYWEAIPEGERAKVEAVGMDMWRPYFESTIQHVPDAIGKIVHDPFHVAQHMNKAVNEVRKTEHRSLNHEGTSKLKDSRNLWLYGFENLPEKWAERFNRLLDCNLKTGRAWAMKEMLRDFWHCTSRDEAAAFFEGWYNWAVRSRLAPVKKVARMLKAHLPNLLTFFIHRLTNAAAEGLNNKIQSLIKKAYGYRNRERFKTDILFHCGDLDLYPRFAQS